MADLFLALQQFHFLRPGWLMAIIALLAAAWLMRKGGRRGGSWSEVIAPELLPYLVEDATWARVNLKPWMIAAGIICCIALAGPTWSKKDVQLHKQSLPLIVLFDLSPSMLAADLKPNRLTRARLKTIDLLKGYQEGSSALIAFAGEAHSVTPITDDTTTIISQLPVLHPQIMPVSGSNPEGALNLAFELAANAGYIEGDILLVTDGVTTDARENLEAALREQPGFRLSILGVGTDEGAPIPLNEHGFARDSNGSIVIAGLKASELAGLAHRNGGVYQTITNTEQDLDNLLAPLSRRNSADAKALERSLDLWEDRGFWLVFLLLPMATALFRKGLVVGILLLPLSFSPDASAGLWEDLWQTRDQQGVAALNEGDPEKAATLFESPLWQGIANHRQGNFDAAADAFSASDSAHAHYNRGNALAKVGKLEAALDAYDQALTAEPNMEDAAFNRKLVEELLQQQQEQQENQEQGNNQDETGENASQSGDNAPPQPDNEQQEQSSGENSDESQRSQGQKNQEDDPDRNQTEDPESSADERQNGAEDTQPQEQAGDESQTEEAAESQPDKPGDEGAEPDGESEGASVEVSDKMSDEERQNAEQWLRRVPDDPGGLLRRKFEYQARQRFREERRQIRTAPGNYTEERW